MDIATYNDDIKLKLNFVVWNIYHKFVKNINMTRFDLLKDIQNIVDGSFFSDTTQAHHRYSMLKNSGVLCNEHYDYGIGYYDISIYTTVNRNGIFVRVWFGTIDDGDFGAWRTCKSINEANKLCETIANKLWQFKRLPSSSDLNILFCKENIYFCLE